MSQVESNGKQVHGDTGEFGQWQFMPGTWHDISIQVLGYVAPQTPINEQYVALMTVQRLLNEGKTERQVALIWNTSLGGTEKPLEIKGTNKKGVKFNSIAHAYKVMTAYAEQ